MMLPCACQRSRQSLSAGVVAEGDGGRLGVAEAEVGRLAAEAGALVLLRMR